MSPKTYINVQLTPLRVSFVYLQLCNVQLRPLRVSSMSFQRSIKALATSNVSLSIKILSILQWRHFTDAFLKLHFQLLFACHVFGVTSWIRIISPVSTNFPNEKRMNYNGIIKEFSHYIPNMFSNQ